MTPLKGYKPVRQRTRFTLMQPSPSAPALADTEEVTGSNPVSPTSIIPGQMRFLINWLYGLAQHMHKI
jgi:hypothetical protein